MQDQTPHGQPSPEGGVEESFLFHVRKSARATLRLALPTMVARAGILVMISSDALMVGHTGQAEFAHLGLSFAVISVLMMMAIGFMQGIMVLTSQAFGAREYTYCGEVWRVGLGVAAVLGLVILAVSLVGDPVLRMLGQNEAMAAGGGAVIAQYGWGMPAMLLYIACGNFLEGLQRPRIGMVIMWSAVVLNLGFNALFLYGLDMGAEGAAAATSVVRWVSVAVIFSYISFVMHDRKDFGVSWSRRITNEAVLRFRRYAKRVLKLGAPMSLQMAVESVAFSTLTLTAGTLGEAQLAAHTVTLQIIQLLFMLAIGMSAATAVRVGYAVGSADVPGVAWAGWTGAGLILLVIAPFSILLALFPEGAARIFITAPDTLVIAKVTILIGSVALIFDCLMTVMLGALRGASDVWVPLIFHIGAMWVVMVPVGRVLALNQEMGVSGLFLGVFAGVLAASVLSSARFYFVSQRKINRA